MKRCSRCGESKSLDDFNRSSGRAGGRQVYCRECQAQYVKTWHATLPPDRREKRLAEGRRRYHAHTPEQRERAQRSMRRSHLLRTYGLTAGSLQELLEAQGGGCAACTSPLNTSGEGMHVDHDHACCPGRRSCGGCVRGLLCASCNTTLGHARDDITRLLGLVRYLRRHRLPQREKP